ncbi:phage tail protein [Paenibacillus nuruki]|uniref:phage tail protein n=1 Tax=Paenibacillus nuruki TaxID=1886670 RepID=UPI002805DACA|nr:phage tail protein [Paenibacillus nuruki]
MPGKSMHGNAAPIRKDPLAAFRFMVQIDQLQVAGFSEISGLQAETKYETYIEGGENGYVHYLPTRREYPPLVFKRGIVFAQSLWNWYDGFKTGSIVKLNGSIMMSNDNYNDFMIWHFKDAYPVKWIGPQLSAKQNDIAFESIEIVHQGLSLDQRSRAQL